MEEGGTGGKRMMTVKVGRRVSVWGGRTTKESLQSCEAACTEC